MKQWEAVGLLTILLASPVAGQHLGAGVPAKSDAHVLLDPGRGIRQGGDTVDSATVIPGLPFLDTGATCGYGNDYDEVCPYANSVSPDVVYSFTPSHQHLIDIDLCGSAYDTKLYVYDQELELIACNDDYYTDMACGVYVSRLEAVLVESGQTYYIVIDGYGGDCGEYVIEIFEIIGEHVECPVDGVEENEPPLVDGYVDAWNGGCNSPEHGYPFQQLTPGADGRLEFCGVSGWYEYQGSDYRDTDWFEIVIGEGGIVTWTCDAEFSTYMFELGPLDCDEVGVLQSLTAGPLDPATMIITGTPQQVVWIWVGSTVFVPPAGYPVNEYDYVLTLEGLMPGVIAVEAATWSAVKNRYR
jgi:hypothetical protein